MNKHYFIKETEFGVTIWFEEDGRKISFGEALGNRHYEEYLEWVEAGGVAEVIEG